jgi:hypothetical protein
MFAAQRYMLAGSSVVSFFIDLLVGLDTLLRIPHALLLDWNQLEPLSELRKGQDGIDEKTFFIPNSRENSMALGWP